MQGRTYTPVEETHEDHRRIMQQHAWLGVATARNKPWNNQQGELLGIPNMEQSQLEWMRPEGANDMDRHGQVGADGSERHHHEEGGEGTDPHHQEE